MEKNEDFLTRKIRAMEADVATAYSGYDRLVRQVNSIRTWTVATLVATLGWKISGKAPSLTSAAVLIGISLCMFFILELRERSSMKFNKKNVETIKKIQMIEDPSEYEKQVRKYIFRELELNEIKRGYKLGDLFESAFQLVVLYWYGLWTLIIFCIFKLF